METPRHGLERVKRRSFERGEFGDAEEATVQGIADGNISSTYVLKPLGSNSSVSTGRSSPSVPGPSSSGCTRSGFSRTTQGDAHTARDQGQQEISALWPDDSRCISHGSGYTYPRSNSSDTCNSAIIIASREPINPGLNSDRIETYRAQPEALWSVWQGGVGIKTQPPTASDINADSREPDTKQHGSAVFNMTTVASNVSLHKFNYGTIHTSKPSTYLDKSTEYTRNNDSQFSVTTTTMMLSPTGSEVGFLTMDSDSRTSSRTSTPTNVRTRPRLPTGLVRHKDVLVAAAAAAAVTSGVISHQETTGRPAGTEDIVCDFDSLGRTDFVRKYSTKGRTHNDIKEMNSMSPGQGTPGMSPKTVQRSLPTSPLGAMTMLPEERSKGERLYRPNTLSGLTPQRSRSVKLKLEKLKEARRTSDNNINDVQKPDPTELAALVRKEKNSSEISRSNSTASCDTDIKTSGESVLDPNYKGKENDVPKGQLHKLHLNHSHQPIAEDRLYHTLPSRHRSVSPKEYSPSPSDLEVRDTLSKTVASDRRLWDESTVSVMSEDSQTQSSVLSDGIQSPPIITSAPIMALAESGLQDPNLDECKRKMSPSDIERSVRVTKPSAVHWQLDKDFVDSEAHSLHSERANITERYPRKVSEGNEDEGVGEIDKESYSLAMSDTGYKIDMVPNLPGKTKSAKGIVWDIAATAETKRNIIPPNEHDRVGPNETETALSKGTEHGDTVLCATGKHPNGRFLTHPPIKDRINVAEGGSMDSNGFGTLKDNKSHPHVTMEMTPQLSASSLDSHMCGGDEECTATYHEVVQDVTAEATDMDKLERKNSKSFKQKSKSDPSGEKQKESLRLQPTLHTQVQSTPTLIDESAKSSQELIGSLKTISHKKTTSVSDSTLAYTGRGDQGLEMLGDIKESTGVSPAESTYILKGQRNTRKQRSGRTLRETKEKESQQTHESLRQQLTPKLGKSRPIAKIIEPQYPEAQSPETQSPENTIDKHSSLKQGSSLTTSLTLPFSKKNSSLTRSQSSASVFINRTDVYRNTTPSPGSSRQKDHAKRRPPLTESLSSSPGSTLDIVGHKRTWGPGTPGAYFPSLEPIFSQSSLSLFEGAAENKDKRDLIVREFYSTEEQYVEALQMLVERYMIPMKTQGVLDSSLVDDIFYKVNEIYMHHATFLTFLGKALQDWDSQTSTIGDIIHRNFSKQTVIESYISFIEHFPRAEKVLDEISAKSSFQKFIDGCERENRMRLPLKANIVKPAQRIPRYELLLKRLLDNTPSDHPDHRLLVAAEKSIHQLALQINSTKESRQEEDYQETLKKLELLLITDLAVADRTYIRHDMVQILSRKDQCCIWLFSDLAVFSSVKRKSGPVNRKTTLLLQSPSGNDFIENCKHKMWLKISLEDLEIVQLETSPTRHQLVDKDILESDVQLLGEISNLADSLNIEHVVLEGTLKDLIHQVTKQLAEHQRKSPPPEANKVELMANTTEGLEHLVLVFPNPDKKASWQGAFMQAKHKLAALAEGKPPEFSQALPITKTRAGMQFSCASPIEGFNDKHFRDVWVCNSDGYVGHMCLLSLQPEPIVTLNTPVPGCSSRILCICAVPVLHGAHKRKLSRRKMGISQPTPPQINVHHAKSTGSESRRKSSRFRRKSSSEKETIASSSDGSSSSSESVLSESEESSSEDGEDGSRSRKESTGSGTSRVRNILSGARSSPQEAKTLDPKKSTMWLGTEDGCILVFPSIENLKTTKNKIKLQQNASVLCLCYLEYKVFAALSNGDLVVYKNNPDGEWELTSPVTLSLGPSSASVTKMMAVAGRVWCSCHQDIYVLNPDTLEVEVSFCGDPETKKPVQCMATSGNGVWLASQGSSKVTLFHAISHQFLMQISVAQAVSHKLQNADDIIRQHKTACLRITSLLTCKDLLWIGTSAGVILTLPLPKISQATSRNSIAIGNVSGLLHGHTGHVRFLACVDLSPQPRHRVGADDQAVSAEPAPISWHSRRMSVGIHTFTMASKMLVISGGDGYEDFRSGGTNESTGRDDSTNHLLIWQV